MTKKNVMKKDSTDSLYFNESTQARIKDFIVVAKTEINKIEKALQVQLGLIIATFQETRGIEGNYQISQDFKKLEKVEEDGS